MWHIIPDSVRTHLKDWEIRFLVLSSLLLQFTLIPTGTRRKATQNAWIQKLVWVTYITAESVPILTLGVISNWLSNMKDQSTSGSVDRKYELIALWAPIVLVHLGGPDSITAYSLEDNELWLRYLVRNSFQIGLTCYIYFLALSSSPLSYIAIAIIVIGILKNFERILSLFNASEDEFRESLTSPPLSGLLYPRVTETFSLGREEGHLVTSKRIAEVQALNTLSLPRMYRKENAYIANQWLNVSKVLLARFIVNLNALENIKSLFTDMISEKAFKIIDIELNLMFELLYTKASIIYKPLGIFSKIITLALTPGVLVAFCMVDKRVYELKLDLSITFVVILGLLISEIYSVIKVFSSDRMYAFYIERKLNLVYRIISYIRSRPKFGWLGFTTEECRWSGTLAHINILALAVRKTPKKFPLDDKIKKLCEKAVQYKSVTYEPFDDGLRMWIHSYVKEKVQMLKEDHPAKPWLADFGVIEHLRKLNLEHLTWSTPQNDFAQCIVIWHIATEILYYKDRKHVMEVDDIGFGTMSKTSRTFSKYLIYLLVRKEAMLPIGMEDKCYAHTLFEARKFFEFHSSTITPHKSKNFKERMGFQKNYQHEDGETFSCKELNDKDNRNEENKSTLNRTHKTEGHESQEDLDLCRICHMLSEVPYAPGVTPEMVEGGGSRSVLFHACHLALQLGESRPALEQRWRVIRFFWTEVLLYSAYHCTGDVHAKHLHYGGELLTHVWLHLAHFGISKQARASSMFSFRRLVHS